MQKLQSSFEAVYLDELFYLDFYSIERFGKTKLGQLLLYAKQNQNAELITQLAVSARPQIEKLITRFAVDAVGFIPPTVKREVQFMVEFAKQLRLTVPIISTTKVTSDVAVPQKTLTKIEDRIENARRTIIVTERKQYKNILLIDDAVGSGATLNETANKLKDQKVATGKVIGLAITGSYKGFDVISEI
jgi:predicted amidophosphoribosyltransferase